MREIVVGVVVAVVTVVTVAKSVHERREKKRRVMTHMNSSKNMTLFKFQCRQALLVWHSTRSLDSCYR